MKKFVIEREVPGASRLSKEEIQAITRTSCAAVGSLNTSYHWVQSIVAGDKIYCIHIAHDENVVREHAKRGGFPANKVSEVTAIFDASFQ